MIVQIYEAANSKEARALLELGIDHIGLLVGPGAFPRELSSSQALSIFDSLPPGTKRLALSLSHDLKELERVVRETKPDILHIGAAAELLSPEQVRSIKRAFPQIQIMRSIPVTGEESIALARAYDGIADWLLLDSHKAGDIQIGALGVTHDWTVSARIVSAVTIPVILAGGLGPHNVADAIAAVRPYGVDSKTKTDRADGKGKDLAKVREFVEKAKVGT